MLFNSLAFLLFLPVVFGLYWSFRSAVGQNRVVVVASMFFYGWWNWRFLLLMVATCVADYWFAQAIERSAYRKRRKHWLLAAIVVNMGLLGVFKYFNFFADNLAEIFSWLGIRADIPTLHIILPIGISFYTFQLTAYVVDVYRGQLRACRSLELFLSFICFFPQLVAGPIERGANLLPQFAEKRVFDYSFAVDGMRLFLWGLMKKMLVADNCAPVADYVFGNYQSLATVDLWIGLFAFTVQVYCDFSGYSDMAIGLGRMFGFRFPENFDYPYCAKSVTEFWRRWHMTLGGWFRDYVYIPLGGNRRGKWCQLRNILVVWFLTGFWHGADWQFIVWGLMYAVLLMLEKLFLLEKLEHAPKVLRHIYVLFFTLMGFVIFNANSISAAFLDIGGLFGANGTALSSPEAIYYLKSYAPVLIFGAVASTPLFSVLKEKAKSKKPLCNAAKLLLPIVLCAGLLLCTAYLVDGSFSPFLYFRF